MALTLAEIKELISYGQEIGLQQLQAEGICVVYGPKQAAQPPFAGPENNSDDTQSIIAHYSAIGRAAIKAHSNR